MKTYKLEGSTLDLAIKVQEEHEAMHKFREELEARMQEEWKAEVKRRSNNAKALFSELCAELGLEASESMNLDFTYVKDHGIAFLIDRTDEDAQAAAQGEAALTKLFGGEMVH